MVKDVMGQVVAQLRGAAAGYYPMHGELCDVRVVGHTPRSDHYIYEIVIDFSTGSERLAAKVYRASRCGQASAQALARREFENLQQVYGIFEEKRLAGVPRPIGEFTALGVVVAEKVSGLPLQSIIMKAALLPGYADLGLLESSARKTGEWLRAFHHATADMPEPFDSDRLLQELKKLCQKCRGEGLDDRAIEQILSGAGAILAHGRHLLPCSAVLNDFSPLNVVVAEDGVGVSEYARLIPRGNSFSDVAQFLAAVAALEKYPFCERNITTRVQEEFLDAYGVSAEDEAILRVLKMHALLGMFAQGRGHTGSAVRKKVMWATVMKRFIEQAAERTLTPAA